MRGERVDWGLIANAANSISAINDRDISRQERRKNIEKREAIEASKQQWADLVRSGQVDPKKVDTKGLTLNEMQGFSAFVNEYKQADENRQYMANQFNKGAAEEWGRIQESIKLGTAAMKENPEQANKIIEETINKSNNAYRARVNPNTGKIAIHYKERGEEVPMNVELTTQEAIEKLKRVSKNEHFDFYWKNKLDIQEHNKKSTMSPSIYTKPDGDDYIQHVALLNNWTRENEDFFFDKNGKPVDTSIEQLRQEGYHISSFKERQAQKAAQAKAAEKDRKQKIDYMKFIASQLKVNQGGGDDFASLAENNPEQAKSIIAQVAEKAEKGTEHEKRLAGVYLATLVDLFPQLMKPAKGGGGDQGGGLKLSKEDIAAIKTGGQQPAPQPKEAPAAVNVGTQQQGAISTGAPTFQPSQDFTSQFQTQNPNIEGPVVPVSSGDITGAIKQAATGAKNFAIDLMQGPSPEEEEQARRNYLGR